MPNPIIAAMIKTSGRSWWQARYSNGSVISEWDTLIKPIHYILHNRSSRWEDVDKNGMVGLRLLCPNGEAGELEAPEGFKFFQLKHGGVDIAMGGGTSTRYTDSNVIGIIEDVEGNCLCYAWEAYERFTCKEFEKAEKLPAHVVNSEDKAKAAVNLAFFHAKGYGKWRWRLVKFSDNVYNMQYLEIGKLRLDVQGVRI